MGSKTTIPPAPGPSQQELDLMSKQTQSLDFYLQGMEQQQQQNQQQGLLMKVTSGLYDPVYDSSGNLTGATLNQQNVANMQAQYAQSQQLQQLAMNRYQAALNGTLPVSQGTLIQKEHDFQMLKSQAAQQGVQIQGDTLDQASTMAQNSTSANELVKNLNQTYQLRESAEQQGQLNQAVPTVGGAASGTLGLTGGATQGFGPGASSQGYLSAVGAAGSMMQPYQQYNTLAYQGQLAQAQINAQQNALPYQLAGQAIGAGGSYLAMH